MATTEIRVFRVQNAHPESEVIIFGVNPSIQSVNFNKSDIIILMISPILHLAILCFP